MTLIVAIVHFVRCLDFKVKIVKKKSSYKKKKTTCKKKKGQNKKA